MHGRTFNILFFIIKEVYLFQVGISRLAAGRGSSSCDAEDGQQLDGLVGRAALGEEGLEGVDGEGEGNDGNGCRHDDDALHPHPGEIVESESGNNAT